MNDCILHHHDPSPFAEKVRLLFGFKDLSWVSVQIPMIMPKPDLTALTGGYRKTPVLQIGADIYCDSRLIAQEIERRFPSPGLFPGGCEGQALALAFWGDWQLFQPGAALSMATNAQIPQDVLDDRMAFFDFLAGRDLAAETAHAYSQFTAGLAQLADMLGDGRPWLLGAAPSWADLSCYVPVWMCRGNIADGAALLAQFPRLLAWEERVAAIGHGQRTDIPAETAFEVARTAAQPGEQDVDPGAWPRLCAGERVTVTPDDYGRDASAGELLRLSRTEIVILRDDERAGRLAVHFPRAGYRVERST